MSEPVTNPWRFQRWAFKTTTGSPGRKAVLSMLAMMADKESGRCEAKQATLAQGTEMSERAVRTHLHQLEADGLIARRPQFRTDRGRRGDEVLLLADGVTEWPDGQPVIVHPADSSGGTPRKPSSAPPRKQASGQEQPLEEQATPSEARVSTITTKEAKPDPHELIPDGFPDDLRPHANAVLSLLRQAAVERGAKAVTVRAVGRVVMDHPRKPLVAAAQTMRAWLLDGNGASAPCKDVVARYRKWVEREQDLAATERLDAAGHPTTSVTRGAARSVSAQTIIAAERRIREAHGMAHHD